MHGKHLDTMLHGLLQSALMDNITYFLAQRGHEFLRSGSGREFFPRTEGQVFVVIVELLGVLEVHFQHVPDGKIV